MVLQDDFFKQTTRTKPTTTVGMKSTEFPTVSFKNNNPYSNFGDKFVSNSFKKEVSREMSNDEFDKLKTNLHRIIASDSQPSNTWKNRVNVIDDMLGMLRNGINGETWKRVRKDDRRMVEVSQAINDIGRFVNMGKSEEKKLKPDEETTQLNEKQSELVANKAKLADKTTVSRQLTQNVTELAFFIRANEVKMDAYKTISSDPENVTTMGFFILKQLQTQIDNERKNQIAKAKIESMGVSNVASKDNLINGIVPTKMSNVEKFNTSRNRNVGDVSRKT